MIEKLIEENTAALRENTHHLIMVIAALKSALEQPAIAPAAEPEFVSAPRPKPKTAPVLEPESESEPEPEPEPKPEPKAKPAPATEADASALPSGERDKAYYERHIRPTLVKLGSKDTNKTLIGLIKGEFKWSGNADKMPPDRWDALFSRAKELLAEFA